MIHISSSANTGELLAFQKKKAKEKDLAFEGRRTDHNLVKELTTDTGSLYRPKEMAIMAALERLGNDSSTDNIKFLLTVAKDLQYGVRTGSKLDRFLRSDSNIKDRKEFQNVNWEQLLEKTVAKALSNCNDKPEIKTALQAEFDKLFPKHKEDPQTQSMAWLSVNPTLGKEKQLIDVRNHILNSKTFVNSDDKENKEIAKKYLDFFIASSEVSFEERISCLQILDKMMSEEYKIHPHLQDKKVQVLAEMINDIVVKVPDEAVLAIKSVDQNQHGMCAAISTSRKAMAHEHKLAYVSNLFAELKDQPNMEIWDVTDPADKAKITVEKPYIDYNAALKQGYRIVDAAVTNWMDFANLLGNGARKAGRFVPFDPEHYGMFRDSHLNVDMDAEHQPKYDLLRATIKTKKAADSVDEFLTARKGAGAELRQHEFTYETEIGVQTRLAENVLKQIQTGSERQDSLYQIAKRIMDPSIIGKEIKDISRQINADESKKAELEPQVKSLKELAIDSKEGPITKTRKIAAIIKEQMPEVPEQKVQEAASKIYRLYEKSEDKRELLDTLKSKDGIKGDFLLRKKLFTMAAYNRVRAEFEVKVAERLNTMAEKLGVPAEEKAVLEKLEQNGTIFSRERLDEIKAGFDNIKEQQEKELKPGQPGYVKPNDLYKTLDAFKDDFHKMQLTLKSIKRQAKRDHLNLNKELDTQLQEVYELKGKAEGLFYVGEEGSSGLMKGQYTRLMKQLSGKDHFSTQDAGDALDHIEAGLGGSVTGTQVSHTSMGGHAQYVEKVIRESVLNPITGEVEEQRVLYHDNTWGKGEFKHTWKDDAGHLRTDYGNGFGGPNGYLLDPVGTQGTTEIDLLAGTGVHKPQMIGKKYAEKFDRSIGAEYPLFSHVILKGNLLSAEEKANDFINQLLEGVSKRNEQKVAILVQRLTTGNTKEIDKFAETLTMKVYKVAIDSVEKGEINNLADRLNNLVKEEVEVLPRQFFQPDGIQKLVNGIAKELPELIEELFSTDIPETVKRIQLSQMIEEYVKTGVFYTTKPGVEINTGKAEQLSKDTDVLTKKLLEIVRGHRDGVLQVYPGMNVEKDKDSAGIRTREEYDAIPEEHILKMILNKLMIMDYAHDTETYTAIDEAKTPEDLKKAKALIVEKQKEIFKTILGKTKENYDEVRGSFIQESGKVIEQIGQQNNLNLESLSEHLDMVSENFAKNYNGSTRVMQEQLQKTIDSMLSRFHKDSEAAYPQVEAQLKEQLSEVLASTFAEHVLVKSVAELEETHKGKALAGWIDAKFDPRDNKEFMQRLNSLQEMDSARLDKLFEKSTAEDMGIKYKDGYKIVLRLRGLNEKATKDFRTAVFHHVYQQVIQQKTEKEMNEIIKEHKAWTKSPEGRKVPVEEQNKQLQEKLNSYLLTKADPTSLYRQIRYTLSHLNLDKANNANKEQAIKKYGARPVFPVIKAATEEQLLKGIQQNLDSLTVLVQQFGEIKKQENTSSNPEERQQLAQMAKQIAQNIKFNEKVIVKGTVRPKHCDDLMRMLNEWVKETSKNPGSPEAKAVRAELETKMVEEHILNYPEELIDAVANEAPKMVFNRSAISLVDQQVIKIWTDAVNTCMKAAKRGEIEFKLRENIAKGKMPQIAKKIRDPEAKYLQNTKTKESIKIESEKGIEFIVHALQDPVNQNSTLKYFIEQTGLTKAFLNHIIEGPAPEASVRLINHYLEQLNNFKADQTIIQNIFNEFTPALIEKLEGKAVPMEALDKVYEQYFAVLDQAFAAEGREESKALSAYKNQLQEALSVAKQLKKQPPEGNAINFMVEVQERILQKQDDYTEEVIERTNMHMNILQGRKNTLAMIEELIPSYDPQKIEIENYKKSIDKAIKDIHKINEELQNPILDKIIAKKKEEQAKQAEMNKQIEQMNQEDMEGLMKKDAEAAIEMLVQALGRQDQMAQQSLVKQILNTQNPFLDQALVDNLFNSDNKMLKTFCAGLLSQKHYFDPLIKYAVKHLDKNGEIKSGLERDDALLLALDGIITATNTKNPQYNLQNTQIIANYFVSSCGHKEPNEMVDAIFSTFLNGLTNKSEMIERMLVGVVMDKEGTNLNARTVAIDLLGRHDTFAFFHLFKDIIENSENYANDDTEKLYVLNVAMKSMFSMANRYSEIDFKPVLDTINKINPENIGQKAKAAGAEAKEIDGEVNSLKDRIKLFNDLIQGKSSADQTVAA
jgi:hypothetical protein